MKITLIPIRVSFPIVDLEKPKMMKIIQTIMTCDRSRAKWLTTFLEQVLLQLQVAAPVEFRMLPILNKINSLRKTLAVKT